jgi:hypothetical protein
MSKKPMMTGVKRALLFLFMASHAVSAFGETAGRQLALDKTFFTELNNTPPVLRDTYLEGMLNSIVTGRGVILSSYTYQRLKKNYRLVLTDREAARKSLKITYHIYVANPNTAAMLEKNALFEFTGQLIAYTPLNSKRDSYIFDILLEKGTVVFE